LALAACAGAAEQKPDLPPPIQKAVEIIDERAGLVLADDGWGDGAPKLVYLGQNWTPLESMWFWFADQGSMLLPYDTFVNLEQAKGEQPFIAPEHMSRFRFL